MFDRLLIEKYRSAENERCKNYKFIARRYFDHPDGEDLVGKLCATAKFAIGTGLFLGLGLATSAPFTTKYTEMFYRTIVPPLKFLAFGEAFTVTTYYSTKLRKADDQINYALGGMMAGFTGATIARNSIYAILGGPLLAFFAALFKDDLMYRPHKTILVQRQISPGLSDKFDWTLTGERKGQWVKEPLSE